MAWGLFIALAASILVFFVLFHLVKKIIPLIIHGVVGMAIFWALNFLGILHVPLDWITFLIAALGGLIGVIIVIALAFFGVPL